MVAALHLQVRPVPRSGVGSVVPAAWRHRVQSVKFKIGVAIVAFALVTLIGIAARDVKIVHGDGYFSNTRQEAP